MAEDFSLELTKDKKFLIVNGLDEFPIACRVQGNKIFLTFADLLDPRKLAYKTRFQKLHTELSILCARIGADVEKVYNVVYTSSVIRRKMLTYINFPYMYIDELVRVFASNGALLVSGSYTFKKTEEFTAFLKARREELYGEEGARVKTTSAQEMLRKEEKRNEVYELPQNIVEFSYDELRGELAQAEQHGAKKMIVKTLQGLIAKKKPKPRADMDVVKDAIKEEAQSNGKKTTERRRAKTTKNDEAEYIETPEASEDD